LLGRNFSILESSIACHLTAEAEATPGDGERMPVEPFSHISS